MAPTTVERGAAAVRDGAARSTSSSSAQSSLSRFVEENRKVLIGVAGLSVAGLAYYLYANSSSSSSSASSSRSGEKGKGGNGAGASSGNAADASGSDREKGSASGKKKKHKKKSASGNKDKESPLGGDGPLLEDASDGTFSQEQKSSPLH